MTRTEEYKALLDDCRKEFPSFNLELKSDSLLMHVIDVFLKMVTFWQMRTFMTDFITTIGYTIYVNDSWGDMPAEARIITVRHERVHMRQRRKYSMLLFTLLYVFLPLPGGLAYFRAKFEREAYAETIRAAQELYGFVPPELKADIVSQFVGPSYFWMWPFRSSIEAWYDGVVDSLRRA